jgi:hypothetical protein
VQYPKTIESAAKLWHLMVGRFITTAEWSKSLEAAYRCMKSSGGECVMRLGGCKASAIMVDAQSAVLIDKLKIDCLDGLGHADCDFVYAENTTKVTSIVKTQINWALDSSRVFPLLLLRPGLKSPMECIALSHTPAQIIVCIPAGNFSFDSSIVRSARDFILANGLEKRWSEASRVRQQMELNEHEKLPLDQKNRLIKKHASLIELIPLSVDLPKPGTGEYRALSECLMDKPEVSLTQKAKAIYGMLFDKSLQKASKPTTEQGVNHVA